MKKIKVNEKYTIAVMALDPLDGRVMVGLFDDKTKEVIYWEYVYPLGFFAKLIFKGSFEDRIQEVVDRLYGQVTSGLIAINKATSKYDDKMKQLIQLHDQNINGENK